MISLLQQKKDAILTLDFLVVGNTRTDDEGDDIFDSIEMGFG